ncbi:hypothetical protein KIH87_18145 [Paraneptunicella aestuarii]|uniref:hypothetical protein n=1 Tax=Paraneptunicella aestuarii TaxID=2831148 RepID=UPI001E29A4CE|nr:hypothetical protein [Paraneptunicella aestuarii]UAA38563.1 hypothetical protein KIH87_18145 [Paraneptunicella aestuarii]
MQKDVYSKAYQELLDKLNQQDEILSGLPDGEVRKEAFNILLGAEELLIRWDEIGVNFSQAISVLLRENERLINQEPGES